jgi:hypothetical protein
VPNLKIICPKLGSDITSQTGIEPTVKEIPYLPSFMELKINPSLKDPKLDTLQS